jgi:hypothetical protein
VHQRSNGYFAQRSTAKAEEQMNSAHQCAAKSERRVSGAPDNEHELSGVAPDCLVPQEDNDANGRLLPNPNGWVTWRHTGQSTVPV